MRHFSTSLRATSRRIGFTLIELSLVLAAISLVTAMGVTTGQEVMAAAKRSATNNKMDAIEKALMAYRVTNNRLPCPSDNSLAATDANYGMEANNAGGTCTGGSPAANDSVLIPKGANDTNIAFNTYVAEGGVPFKALNLPPEFAIDGWGRRITYAVWTPITAASAFISYRVSPSCGAITVEDAGHGYRTQSAVYALASFGPDGHGGYQSDGTRYNAKSANADEQTDAHYDNNGADTAYAATYIQKDWTENPGNPLDTFDDVVRFKNRWQMMTRDDEYLSGQTPCTPGFIINGYAAHQFTGVSQAVGDVNGDGIPDLIIGAPQTNDYSGTVYGHGIVFVIFGTKSGFPDPLPLDTLDGGNGVEIDGPACCYNQETGWAVTTGDVNGDGVSDIIIGSPQGGATAAVEPPYGGGGVYVVFGHTGSWTTPIPLTSGSNPLDGMHGFEIDGTTVSGGQFPHWGQAIAAGDINGDGVADIIVGCRGWGGTTACASNTGSVDVVFGHTGSWAAAAANSTLVDGTHGFELTGTSSNPSVATGDINGDGVADLVIGNQNYSGAAGQVWVIWGSKTAPWPATPTVLNAAYLNGGATGVEFDGTSGYQTVGASIAVSDVNGDGIADLVIGGWDAYNTTLGAVFAVFGHGGGWSTPVTLQSNVNPLDGTHGFELDGSQSGAMIGESVSVGDVNGDGIADIIAGGPSTFTYYPGANYGATPLAYVVLGQKCGSTWGIACTATTTLQSNTNPIDGTHGFELDGPAESNTGYAVTSADLNGDGKAEIIVSAPYNSPSSGADAGSTYVFYGKSSSWPARPFDLGGL